MKTDPVEAILAQWQSARPDLDCSPMGIVGRVNRMARLFGPVLNKVFKAHELSSVEFDILATLRRSEDALTPTQLYQTLMLSSGAMSTRIDQLVKNGLLTRIASGEDRRSNRVALTEEGQSVVDAALNDHVENLHRLTESLTKKEQTQLAGLLSKLLVATEGH